MMRRTLASLLDWWEWPIAQWWWYRQYKRADRKAYAKECQDIHDRARKEGR
jgi:hypothetical protein